MEQRALKTRVLPPEASPAPGMDKRSLTIAGHRTSLALEAEFWDGLEEIAAQRSLTLPRLIAEIDRTRTATNLASAVRLAVLDHYRTRAGRTDLVA
ncbi:hypothetical protein ABB55_03555 [Prosthecomicrobium hirschii]|uniref:Ribbon-helix-helix domain-containing protein n=1 Tax=Prosthecodimorpha hirschii TaxID=665126 RepID=A0A0N8GEG0_9HYPH|nr:ribbon-helix-helix domain-containing protein [Prosthecomicrobium hirschii]KPL51417.1 hypothetical protein ABB55_03555 [Prosthecomicrobium hirschii]